MIELGYMSDRLVEALPVARDDLGPEGERDARRRVAQGTDQWRDVDVG